jgi:hypothetical protein
MKLFLLDAGGAGLVLFVLLFFMAGAIIIEALTMLLLKYNKPGKAFLDSLVINLVSLIAGYVVIYFNETLDITNNEIANLFLLFLLTVIIEAGILYFLNKNKPLIKTIIIATIINLITYTGLYLMQVL